jgi:hypothetical protein
LAVAAVERWPDLEVNAYLAKGEPITSTATAGRDLGKRRFAQRFPVVPW